MIQVIDNDPNNLTVIQQYCKDRFPKAPMEISETMPVPRSGNSTVKDDIVIVNADIPDASPDGWLHLIGISQSAGLLILIIQPERAGKLKSFLKKPIVVLEAPVTCKKVEKALSTLKKKTTKQIKAQIQDEDQNLSRLRDHLFSNLLEGHDLPQNIGNTMEFLGLTSEINKYYLAFVISLPLPAERSGGNDEIWKKTLMVQTIIREEIQKIVPMRSCVRDAGRIACLLLMKEPGDPFRYELEKVLEIIEKRVSKEYNLRITVGVGLAYDTIDDIVNSYHQACDALNQGNFFGNSFVCFFCDLYERDSRRFQLSRKLKEKITQSLYLEQFTEIDDLIENEFQNIIQSGLATKDNILALKIDLIIFLMDLSNKLSVISERPKVYSRLLNDLLSADSLPSLEYNIKKNLRDLSAASHNILKKRSGKLISDAQGIVLEKLQEPVNVQLIAQQMRISPNYLSAIFKAETGIRLTEYITNIKMREAARLLRESNRNILEITSLVGYDNANYFSRLFKKQYGITPSEYRHNPN